MAVSIVSDGLWCRCCLVFDCCLLLVMRHTQTTMPRRWRQRMRSPQKGLWMALTMLVVERVVGLEAATDSRLWMHPPPRPRPGLRMKTMTLMPLPSSLRCQMTSLSLCSRRSSV